MATTTHTQQQQQKKKMYESEEEEFDTEREELMQEMQQDFTELEFLDWMAEQSLPLPDQNWNDSTLRLDTVLNTQGMHALGYIRSGYGKKHFQPDLVDAAINYTNVHGGKFTAVLAEMTKHYN